MVEPPWLAQRSDAGGVERGDRGKRVLSKTAQLLVPHAPIVKRCFNCFRNQAGVMCLAGRPTARLMQWATRPHFSGRCSPSLSWDSCSFHCLLLQVSLPRASYLTRHPFQMGFPADFCRSGSSHPSARARQAWLAVFRCRSNWGGIYCAAHARLGVRGGYIPAPLV